MHLYLQDFKNKWKIKRINILKSNYEVRIREINMLVHSMNLSLNFSKQCKGEYVYLDDWHRHEIFNAIFIICNSHIPNTSTYVCIFSYGKDNMEHSEDPQNLYRFNNRQIRLYIKAKWHIAGLYTRWFAIWVRSFGYYL